MRPILAPPPPSTTRPTAPTTTLPDLDRRPLGRYLLHPQRTLAAIARTLAHHAADSLHRSGLWLLLLAVVLLAARLALARWRAARLRAGARLVEILPPPQVDLDGAHALWRNLAGLRQHRLLQGRPHVAFEYRWTPRGLTIAVWLPGMVAPRLVERAVEAAWPGARTRTTTPAPPPLPVGEQKCGGQLRLAQPEWYPLRGQAEHPADPLRGLLGAAEELGAGESAIVQVLARPAKGRRLARCRRAARALRRGQHPTRPGRLLDLLNPTSTTMGSRRAYTDDPARHADVQAISRKAAGPGFQVAIRYGVATSVDHHVRGRLRARAHALAAAFAIYTGRNRLVRTHHPSRLALRPLAERRLGLGMLLSLDELAALAHLPWDRAVPGLARAGARSVVPPPSAPREGKVLGDADAGPPRPVALDPVDARQHTHLVGATGSGKSTLLGNLVLQDVDAGRGVILVDPAKGDLVRELLDRLPRSAKDRLVLLDPDERHAPPTLNVLEGPDPELAVDHLLSSLRRVFASSWGPRTDDVLRSACLTLLHRGPATLADVPRLLTDPGFRHHTTTDLKDDLLRGFWDGYEQLSPSGHAQLVGPALARLRAFLLRSFVRDVVGSTTSSINLAEVLDGGILLARLPKGMLGEDTARLLGSFVIAKTWQATAERAAKGEQTRNDAALYLDEFHNVLHLPYAYEELLAEARGYRLALTLAHHNLAQLPRELREAISANARTKIFFTVSPEDAHLLERHVAPELGAHDLSHLGGFQAAARLVAGGVEAPACTLVTRSLPEAIPGRAEELRAAARARVGRPPLRRRAEQQRRQAVEDQPPRRRRSTSTRRPAPPTARPDPGAPTAHTPIVPGGAVAGDQPDSRQTTRRDRS